MASRYWIKLYHELLDDPKIGRLTDSQFRLAINLFLLAGDYEQDGRLPALDDIRWRLRDPDHFDADLSALISCDILTDSDGTLQVTRFSERQSAMSAEERSRLRQQRVRRSDYYMHETGAQSARIVHESARNMHESGIDVDVDKDIDKEEDVDVDEEEDAHENHKSRAHTRGSSVNPQDPLVKCFIEHTSIPLNTGGKQKWAQALQRLRSAGVTADDLTAALAECRAKNPVIASLASIVNPAIIARSRRASSRASPPDSSQDYRRYLKGQYGDFGIS